MVYRGARSTCRPTDYQIMQLLESRELKGGNVDVDDADSDDGVVTADAAGGGGGSRVGPVRYCLPPHHKPYGNLVSVVKRHPMTWRVTWQE